MLPRTFPRSVRSDEIVLFALVLYPCIIDFLYAEFIVKIDLPPYIGPIGQAIFLCLKSLVEDVVWRARLKGPKDIQLCSLVNISSPFYQISLRNDYLSGERNAVFWYMF